MEFDKCTYIAGKVTSGLWNIEFILKYWLCKIRSHNEQLVIIMMYWKQKIITSDLDERILTTTNQLATIS